MNLSSVTNRLLNNGLNAFAINGATDFAKIWKTGMFVHISSQNLEKYTPSKVKLDKGSEVKWCSCGKTSKKPFCDGSDTCNGKPVAFKPQATKEYIFCNCKCSKNKPFCDGTHATI